jgi:hypothetical protein
MARITSIEEGDGGGGTNNRLQPFYSNTWEESGWEDSGGIGARHGRGEAVVAGARECALQQAKDVGRAAVLVVACVFGETWL